MTLRRTLRSSVLPCSVILSLLGACASGSEHRSVAEGSATVTYLGTGRAAGTGQGNRKPLTLDALYDAPDKRVDFSGNPPSNLVWIDDAHYLWPKSEPRGARADRGSEKPKPAEWLLVEADSGKTEPFAPVEKVEAALAAVPEIGAEKAKRLAHTNPDAWAGNPKALLFTVTIDPPKDAAEGKDKAAKEKPEGKEKAEPRAGRRGTAKETESDLFVYTFADGKVTRATTSPEPEEEAELSPDGKSVAFLRGNDLYVADVASGDLHRVTDDGSATVLNGRLDWLYQEEIFGRGTWRAFWWSPDSSAIAFLRLDETGVPIYTLVDDVESPARVETSPYPRAGDTNPTVKLGVAKLGAEKPAWVDLSKYAGGDFLIVEVAWSPKSDLSFQVQDREQTWLDLDSVQGASGEPKGGTLAAPSTILRETTKTWAAVNGPPKWLADGSFLWFSEKTGWQQLYHYDAAGKLLGTLTSGGFETRDLRGIDEANGWVYVAATERSPIGLDEYRVKLDGTGFTRLTKTPGSHGAKYNPSFTRFIDRASDASTPTQVKLARADGTEVRTIDANVVPALAEWAWTKPEFVKVPTRDGFQMEAMLIKPPDFDPSKRYPVFQSTYAGPHSPSVHDAWAGNRGMFLQLVAQQGIVVWVCDNRSASGKGLESTWACYQKFGESELADIEDGLAWLKKHPWIDGDRIGISGWSFGGFMTSYALTHSKSFAMGIAGGSVTDWHNYDSVYTERYMKTPEHNKDGYARTSVVAAAKDLHGELFLIHGAIDDNVHPQNTSQLVYALQKAGKPFRMMLYPKSRHGVADPQQVKHLQGAMLDFIRETLLRKEPVAP
jgi:dipeptidyl-peptidase-4